MALTKEQILSLIKKNDEIKKIFELFKLNNLNTITSNYTEDEETQTNVSFVESYKEELSKFLNNNGNPINIHSRGFKNAMKELGTSDFIDVYDKASKKLDDIKNNPLNDPTLTDAQRKGLKEFHKWLYRNADKTGFIGIGNNGSMRDFANDFMKQPAAVQLKALYLLQTGKRKNPSDTGIDDLNSQLTYVPHLDMIKKPLIATKWKFWKRTNGSHLYWEKLSDSLNIAKEDADELVTFRKDITDAENTAENPNDYKKNGFSEKACLKAIDKLLENENFLSTDGKPDQFKKDYYTGIRKYAAEIFSNEKLSQTTKMEVAEHVLEVFGASNSRNDKIRTAKGFGDFVEGAILDHEDNFYNIEYSMQAILLSLSKDAVFDNAPTIREMITENSLAAIPGAAFDGVALAGDIVNLINHAREIKKTYNDAGKMQGISTALEFGGDLADIGYRGASLVSGVGEVLDASEEVIDAASNVADMCFGAYNALETINSTVNAIDAGINRSKVTKAVKNLDNLDEETREEVKEEVENIAEVSRFINEKNQHSAIRGMVKGGLATGMSFASASIGTVPVLGQAMLAGVVGLSLYEQAKEEKNRRDIARKVVDTIVIGKDKIGEMTGEFVRKLEDKLKKYDKKSDEYKRISAMVKNKDKAKDKIRNEEAVKEGNASLFSSTSNIMDSLGETMMKQVYLIDPEKGFTEDNLITAENEKKTYETHKEKTSYKALLESTGQTVKFESSKNIREKGVKKYQKELAKKVSDQITK